VRNFRSRNAPLLKGVMWSNEYIRVDDEAKEPGPGRCDPYKVAK
jgi:hypothetical protein